MQKYRAIITGVSRGLGKDVLKLILKNHPSYQVIGTVRKLKDQYKNQIDVKFPNNLAQIQLLDLCSQQSITNFGSKIKQKGFYFDCLINNSAINADYGSQICSEENAKSTFQTNLLGTIQLTYLLLPMLRQHGRIINVSSQMGALGYHGNSVIQKFNDPAITLEEIKKQANNYIEGCRKRNVGPYYKSCYGTSKMMLNAWSRYILKKQLTKTQTTIAMSPGHCKTDMGSQKAPRTCLEGATSIYQFISGTYTSDKFYHINYQTNYYQCQ